MYRMRFLAAGLALLLTACAQLVGSEEMVFDDDPITAGGPDAVDKAIADYDAAHVPYTPLYFYALPDPNPAQPTHPDIAWCGQADPPAGGTPVEPAAGELSRQDAANRAEGVRVALGFPQNETGWNIQYTPAGFWSLYGPVSNGKYTCVYGAALEDAFGVQEGEMTLCLDAVTGEVCWANLNWPGRAEQEMEYRFFFEDDVDPAVYAAWAAEQNRARTSDPIADAAAVAAAFGLPTEGWQACLPDDDPLQGTASWLLPEQAGGGCFDGVFINPGPDLGCSLYFDVSICRPYEMAVHRYDNQGYEGAGYYSMDWCPGSDRRWRWFESQAEWEDAFREAR